MHWSPVFTGGTDSVPQAVLIEWKLREFSADRCFPLLRMHFHPECRGRLELSETDPWLVDYPSEPKLRPVVAIGTIVSDGRRGHSLWLQKLFEGALADNPSVVSQFLEQYSQWGHLWPASSLSRLLAVPAYQQAAVLPFSIQRPNRMSSLEHPRRLERFSLTYLD